MMTMNNQILMYGVIGKEIRALDIINQLRKIEDSNATEVNITGSSPGGSIQEGFIIYNAFKNTKLTVNFHIDSYAYSMMAYIFLAGDNRTMDSKAKFMVHKPLTPVGGNADDLREMAQELDEKESIIISDTAKASGLSEEEIKGYFVGDGTFFTAEEAVKKGFAHMVTEPLKAVAFYDEEEPLLDDGVLNTGIAGDMEGNKMPESKAPELPVIDKAYLEANCADILAEIKSEAHAEGVNAECARIKSLEELSAKGYEDVLMECKFDGKTTQAEAAVMMVKAFKDKGDTYLEAMKADAKESDEIVESSIVDEVKSDDPVACWESDSKLRAEFGDDKDAYMAYKKATDNGLVKIRGDK